MRSCSFERLNCRYCLPSQSKRNSSQRYGVCTRCEIKSFLRNSLQSTNCYLHYHSLIFSLLFPQFLWAKQQCKPWRQLLFPIFLPLCTIDCKLERRHRWTNGWRIEANSLMASISKVFPEYREKHLRQSMLLQSTLLRNQLHIHA